MANSQGSTAEAVASWSAVLARTHEIAMAIDQALPEQWRTLPHPLRQWVWNQALAETDSMDWSHLVSIALRIASGPVSHLGDIATEIKQQVSQAKLRYDKETKQHMAEWAHKAIDCHSLDNYILRGSISNIQIYKKYRHHKDHTYTYV